MDLLQHFPYPEAREIQAQALRTLGDNWDKYDVFVLVAPTAFGKTAVAKTLMNAFGSVSAITPNNLLVQQFREEFPDTCTLSRLDSYRCPEWQRPCSVTRGKMRQFCKGCPASKDLARAKYRRGPGIYNYHIHLAQKLHRDVLVVDEAHNLIPFIRERMAQRLWQHDYRYPGNTFTVQQMADWVQTLPVAKRRHQKVQLLEDAVVMKRPTHTAGRTKASFNGKGTLRGEAEERDCIELLPVDIRGAPPFFWPKEVQKIVLLSATISMKDIETLGLARRRVLEINCESPIPAASRPIVEYPVAAVNRTNILAATKLIASTISTVIAPAHVHEKGIIHATYQQATILQQELGGSSRYLFHDRFNKKEIYQRFRNLPASSGAILVASGMYEGIDLPEDSGRWQVITKIPWPSLGNPAIKYLADQDPEWFLWETLKITMQACGRICRNPGDFGVTYIMDSSFDRLKREGIKAGLVPLWYLEGIEAGGM